MSNDITIVNTLELPSPQEWQEGLNLNPFKKLTIDISTFVVEITEQPLDI